MEKGYFAAAWGDVTKSPGWVSTLLRLGLLCLVPIFGVIVLYGYLYSWARDISWNVHRPLPEKLLANEDGNLYKRGFFILVVTVVFSLIPSLFSSVASLLANATVLGAGFYGSYAPIALGFLLWLAGGAASVGLAFVAVFFSWVGSLRVSLYGTLSSGFQVRKIWAMMRYDFIGLLRILGMNLLIGLAICFGAVTLAFLLVLLCSGFIFVLSGSSGFSMVAAIVLAAVACLFLIALLFCTALQSALTIRALGYWARQFEVSEWRGQEDPMPFEERAPFSSSCKTNAMSAESSQDAEHCHQAEFRNDTVVVAPIPNANDGAIAQPAPYAVTGKSTIHTAQAFPIDSSCDARSQDASCDMARNDGNLPESSSPMETDSESPSAKSGSSGSSII